MKSRCMTGVSGYSSSQAPRTSGFCLKHGSITVTGTSAILHFLLPDWDVHAPTINGFNKEPSIVLVFLSFFLSFSSFLCVSRLLVIIYSSPFPKMSNRTCTVCSILYFLIWQLYFSFSIPCLRSDLKTTQFIELIKRYIYVLFHQCSY